MAENNLRISGSVGVFVDTSTQEGKDFFTALLLLSRLSTSNDFEIIVRNILVSAFQTSIIIRQNTKNYESRNGIANDILNDFKDKLLTYQLSTGSVFFRGTEYALNFITDELFGVYKDAHRASIDLALELGIVTSDDVSSVNEGLVYA